VSSKLRAKTIPGVVDVDAEDQASKETSQARIVTWPHPKYDGKTFKVMVIGSTFNEIHTLAPPDTDSNPTSWFIENDVVSNGALYLATPIDPLLLLLPWLVAARKKAGNASFQLAQSLSFLETRSSCAATLLTHFTEHPQRLDLICESSPSHGTVRLADDRLYGLLTRKVVAAAAHFARLPAFQPAALASGAATAAELGLEPAQLASGACGSAAASAVLTAALGFASEYLPPSVTDELVSRFKDHEGAPITAAALLSGGGGGSAAGGSGDGAGTNGDGQLTGDRDCSRDAGEIGQLKRNSSTNAAKPTAADNKRAKAAQVAARGNSLISSFFTKK
jgi:ribonuclease H2 subunit B